MLSKKDQEITDLKQQLNQMDRHVNELNLELQDLRETCGEVDELKEDI